MGWVLSIIAILFLLFDSAGKLLRLDAVIKGTVELGFPESTIQGIGILLLICTVLYAIPKSAIFGAILLTGYLGGAIATQVRVSAPLISNVLFPVYMALFLWVGLYLRSVSLRKIITKKNY